MDPFLSKYAVIIVDEAHERTVHTDVLMGLLKNVQHARSNVSLGSENGSQCGSFLRKNNNRKYAPLKIIIMSASLDAQVFSEYFGGAKAVHVQGRQFPVDIFYTRQAETDYLDASLITIFQVISLLDLLYLNLSSMLEIVGCISASKFLSPSVCLCDVSLFSFFIFSH